MLFIRQRFLLLPWCGSPIPSSEIYLFANWRIFSSTIFFLTPTFLLRMEKKPRFALCTRVRYAYVSTAIVQKENTSHWNCDLSIDARATGAIYRKRDQHRHLSAENTCRRENLPHKSVVRKRKKKEKKGKKTKKKGKEKREEEGGEKKKRRGKKTCQREL